MRLVRVAVKAGDYDHVTNIARGSNGAASTMLSMFPVFPCVRWAISWKARAPPQASQGSPIRVIYLNAPFNSVTPKTLGAFATRGLPGYPWGFSLPRPAGHWSALGADPRTRSVKKPKTAGRTPAGLRVGPVPSQYLTPKQPGTVPNSPK